MNTIFRLCKKVTDPPGETKGEWKSMPCCVCGVAVRATVKATNAASKLEVYLNAICFDCAVNGPEWVLKKYGSCAKVS
jgi:hypothetical protein